MFEIVEHNSLSARIKVIGIGGGGGNAVNTMIGSRLAGVGDEDQEVVAAVTRRGVEDLARAEGTTSPS